MNPRPNPTPKSKRSKPEHQPQKRITGLGHNVPALFVISTKRATVISGKKALHYIEQNSDSARTVILLHGLGVNSASWQMQIPALVEAGFHVLAPDLRGFGQSRYPGRMNVPVMAGDIIALLAALRPGQAVDVVGISMGGAVGQQLVIDAPHLVRRLILINTFAKIKPQGLSDWFYLAIRMIFSHTLGIESQGRVVAERLFPEQEQQALREAFQVQIAQADPRAYRAALRMLGRFDVLEQLRTIQARTLVISSEDDTTVGLADQRALATGIPRARQVLITAGGHAIIVSKPDVVNPLILDFLLQEFG